MLDSSDWTDPVEPSNVETVNDLVARFTPEQLATAYLRLYREKRSAPEELADPSTPTKPREAFGPSVWFSLDGGHKAQTEARRVLPMLCKMGNISREDVGAIRIQENVSLIEIRQSAVKEFLSAVGPDMTLENGAKLIQMEGSLDLDHRSGKRKGVASTERKVWPDKTLRGAQSGKSGTSDTEGATPPIDRDDAPRPVRKKLKLGAQPASGQKPKSPSTEHEPAKASKWKPRKAKERSRPATGSAGKSSGSKTPVGKPSSKKNRARQLAKSAAGGAATPARKDGGRSGKPRSKS